MQDAEQTSQWGPGEEVKTVLFIVALTSFTEHLLCAE